jgi:hypothetical protein
MVSVLFGWQLAQAALEKETEMVESKTSLHLLHFELDNGLIIDRYHQGLFITITACHKTYKLPWCCPTLTDHTLISLFTPYCKIIAMRLGRALQAADFKTEGDLGLEEFSPVARSLWPQYESNMNVYGKDLINCNLYADSFS